MSVLCLPFGPRADIEVGRIIQAQGMLIMLFEDLTANGTFSAGGEEFSAGH
jgi:hypothetical protein